jgi:hypothetical protein
MAPCRGIRLAFGLVLLPLVPDFFLIFGAAIQRRLLLE